MCGRFTLTLPDYATLAAALGVEVDPELSALYRPRYNVAPTDRCFVLRVKDGRREIVPATWGLVNAWASDRSSAAKQILARVETVAERPAFRDAVRRRRCVVPADGFYEWFGARGDRRPFWFGGSDGGLLLFAAIHESWGDPRTGSRERTFAILTEPANDVVAPVHDRMPVLIDPARMDEWLTPATADQPGSAGLVAIPRDSRADRLVVRAVGPRVSSVAHDDPACLDPAPAEGQLDLFAAPVRRGS